MIIVVDVNPFISALIKDSTSRTIIMSSAFEFCIPEHVLQKVRKYKNYILGKSGLAEPEFTLILNSMLRSVKIVPLEKIDEQWSKAKRIMEHIDPEDIIIIATALSQENAFIWSDDKHFNQQTEVNVLKTKDLIELV